MSTPHLWVRAEARAHESRVGLTPEGATTLLQAGFAVTVEVSDQRCFPTSAYREAGCAIARVGGWATAPSDAVIFGLKELPEDDTPLVHRHIMFGHAFKGQATGARLLRRFVAGGGTLLDLEYLTDDNGRRVAAFGYWAGYAGAALSVMAWTAQQSQTQMGPVGQFADADAMKLYIKGELAGRRPDVLTIGALGRVGTGAGDLCRAVGLNVTKWDMAETSHGGPFPDILQHDLFLNCILAGPETPVFIPADATTAARRLRVIGDIACDPESDFSPIKVYHQTTTWDAPVLRVHDAPPLDVMAIDNLPSLLPRESSDDFARQLLPQLQNLADGTDAVWERARACFESAIARLA